VSYEGDKIVEYVRYLEGKIDGLTHQLVVKSGECTQEIRFLQARLDRVQEFLKDQWSLIPISTLARPGSYARGVQTGMSDVLAGLQRVLVWASHGGADSNVQQSPVNDEPIPETTDAGAVSASAPAGDEK
jgi:hypothetical protein